VPRRGLAIGAVAAASLLALPVAPARAKHFVCPTHVTEITRSGAGALYTDRSGHTLWRCEASEEQRPTNTKLGPWTKQSMAYFDGNDVVWTVRITGTTGHREDAMWAADDEHGTWMRGLRPVVGTGAKTDVHIERLGQLGSVAAWVTTRGTVVVAVPRPGLDPETVGEDTPGATAPAGTTVSPTSGAPLGLVTALRPRGGRLVIGRWEGLSAGALADSLDLRETGSDDSGDQCSGQIGFQVTVQPVADQPPVGAQWFTQWQEHGGICG
jgi:hypothetical protein